MGCCLFKSVQGDSFMQKCIRAGWGDKNQSPKPSRMPAFSLLVSFHIRQDLTRGEPPSLGEGGYPSN